MNTCAELFVESLKEKDLNFESGTIKDGDSVVEFPYKGKVVKMFFSGEQGEYLSLYLVYEHVPAEKQMDTIMACNELNTAYKWVTFYVDRDNDVICHHDAILTVENAAKEALELLIRMVHITIDDEDVKKAIMKAIYA